MSRNRCVVLQPTLRTSCDESSVSVARIERHSSRRALFSFARCASFWIGHDALEQCPGFREIGYRMAIYHTAGLLATAYALNRPLRLVGRQQACAGAAP